MNKKYYFRGLGLGIIVTAVIMGIALSGGTKKRTMTDDEIIARAKELGMTENTRLLEPSGEEAADGTGSDGAKEPETVKEPVKKDVAVAAQKPGAEDGDPQEETPEETSKETSQEEASPVDKADARTEKTGQTAEKPQDKKPAANTNEMTKPDDEEASGQKASAGQTAAAVESVTIVSGDGSYTVAKKLAEAGIVSSAASFDTFLCERGYDKRLRTGTFQIPADASDEQIARIVTGQE